jgi:hypothetical protein
MNSRSITDYILKLEKENRDQAETIRTLTFNEIDLKKQIRDFKKKSPDSYEVNLVTRLSNSRSYSVRQVKRRSMPSMNSTSSST